MNSPQTHLAMPAATGPTFTYRKIPEPPDGCITCVCREGARLLRELDRVREYRILLLAELKSLTPAIDAVELGKGRKTCHGCRYIVTSAGVVDTTPEAAPAGGA
jgi:hypothetical protein